MRIDLRAFDLRNVWPLPNGELAVRPALREAYTAPRQLAGGFTLKNPYTDEVQHVLADVATSGAQSVDLYVTDGLFATMQKLTVGTNIVPRVITHGVLGDEFFISSPDLPPLMGIVGGGIALATKRTATSSNFSTIDIPRGITCVWQERRVIADGAVLYFSEPRAPRTFLSGNFVVRSAPIYGIHVSVGGALVVCQRDGVFTLPPDAASSGALVFGMFDKLTDHETVTYQQTCVSRGRLYGLTARGIRPLDTKGEMLLDEQDIPRYFGPRIAFPDYRDGGVLFGGAVGPVAAIGDYVHMTDMERKVRSWWSSAIAPTDFRLRGLLYTETGEEMLLTRTGVYRAVGNVSEAVSPTVRGIVAGRIPTLSKLSPVVREVTFASDTPGSVHAALRGQHKSAAVPQVAPIIGTSSWGAGTYYREGEIRSRRFQFAKRTDDISVEFAADYPLSRITLDADIEMGGIGRGRP